MNEELSEKLVELETFFNQYPPGEKGMDKFLSAENSEVRKKFARLIWEHPYKQYVEPLFQLAEKDSELKVRKRAIK